MTSSNKSLLAGNDALPYGELDARLMLGETLGIPVEALEEVLFYWGSSRGSSARGLAVVAAFIATFSGVSFRIAVGGAFALTVLFVWTVLDATFLHFSARGIEFRGLLNRGFIAYADIHAIRGNAAECVIAAVSRECHLHNARIPWLSARRRARADHENPKTPASSSILSLNRLLRSPALPADRSTGCQRARDTMAGPYR